MSRCGRRHGQRRHHQNVDSFEKGLHAARECLAPAHGRHVVGAGVFLRIPEQPAHERRILVPVVGEGRAMIGGTLRAEDNLVDLDDVVRIRQGDLHNLRSELPAGVEGGLEPGLYRGVGVPVIRGSVSDPDGNARRRVEPIGGSAGPASAEPAPRSRAERVIGPTWSSDQTRGPDALQADTTARGLQTGHDAAGRRDPDAAAGVAPERGKRKVCGGERPPEPPLDPPTVRSGACGWVTAAVRTPKAPGVACTHADDDGTGAAKLSHHLRVRLGTIVGEKVEPRRAYRRGWCRLCP